MNRREYEKAIEDAVNVKTNKKKPFTYEKKATDMYKLLNKYGSQEQAIEWAKSLSQQYNDEKFANHNPATQVFELVEELIGKSDELNEEIKRKFNDGK
jgi:DNA helicase IV